MALVARELDVDVLPADMRDEMVQALLPKIKEPGHTKADLIRFVLSSDQLHPLQSLTQDTIAKFLRCSRSHISRIAQVLMVGSQEKQPKSGRPTFLSQEAESRIKDYVFTKCAHEHWPTLNEFKELVHAELQKQQPQLVPSKQYYSDLFDRLLGEEYKIKIASPLDPERYAVTPETIREHFAKLEAIGVRNFDPRLILNLDETGFGASKSGRARGQKVIIPNGFRGSPVYERCEEKRYVTCLACSSLYGSLLPPALVTSRRFEALDGSKCSFFANCPRYTSESAFVTSDIFSSYISHVVFEYIEHVRNDNCKNRTALLIFDGCKSHITDMLKAACAERDIIIYVLPPHSSHLVQPLDQMIFQRMKREFATIAPIRGLSKISGTLERVWSAYQAADVCLFIWQSWAHCGIDPIVEDGRCVGCLLNPDLVLDNKCLKHEMKVNEHSRGRPVCKPKYGVLNEAELEIYEAGQCPFCGQPY